MNLSPKQLIKILESSGYIFKRTNGSHHLFFNPNNNKTVIVPIHSNRDLKKGTFMAILKQAGIDKNEINS
ncbi:MAG: type II toxin-antitoxin system HicA family toxin [Saprospiraceae bacterium]|nr:type II toxin-antitoxin system HicA family toxin [Saprospiraceae bacterium]